MREVQELRQFCLSHSDQDLILCTIVDKKGSSYRSTGAQKIVARGGGSAGFLTGGCLEGAIDEAARETTPQEIQTLWFSTASDEDRLLGYQTGCQGQIEVRFECLPNSWTEDLLASFFPLNPLRLIVIGAGADARPLIEIAGTLGWEVQILDYRKNLLADFRHLGERALTCRTEEIAAKIPAGPRTAVILQTHNYEADLEILRPLVGLPLGYLGCVGPHKRWERLQEDLLNMHHVAVPAEWKKVVHAPAGIFARSQNPTDVALSIVAQIQEKLVESQTQKSQSHWSLVLAAGESKRFGGPKFLAPWRNGTLLDQVQATAEDWTPGHSLIVTGAWHQQMQGQLRATHSVHNPNWHEGMGKSLAVGLAEILRLDPSTQSVTVLPLDQPLISRTHLAALKKLAHATGRVAFTKSSTALGPPAVIPLRFFARILQLQGDRGLKSVLHSAEWVSVSSETALQDIDTPADLHRVVSACAPL